MFLNQDVPQAYVSNSSASKSVVETEDIFVKDNLKPWGKTPTRYRQVINRFKLSAATLREAPHFNAL